MVNDLQLLPQVVAGTQTHTGFEQSTFRSKGECANQYTTIALTTKVNYSLMISFKTSGIL